MTTDDRRTGLLAEGLLHPCVVASIVVLVVNDRWGKTAHPGLITGKLSDAAGLVFFPFVLVGLVEVARIACRRPRPVSVDGLRWAIIITAVAFSLVKAAPAVADAYSHLLGDVGWLARQPLAWLRHRPSGPSRPLVVRADLTDLVTLPMLAVPWSIGRSLGHSQDRSVPDPVTAPTVA